jgi:hypothetical protein
VKITRKLLKKHNACAEGMRWVTEHKLIDKPAKSFISALIKGDRAEWANWLIVRLLNHDGQIMYAIYAAEQVIGIFEKEYPKDDRPRKAIEAAKKYLATKSEEDWAAARTAGAAAWAAWAAAEKEMKINIIHYGLSILPKYAEGK